MSDSNNQISRRNLLKFMGAGAGMLAVGGATGFMPKPVAAAGKYDGVKLRMLTQDGVAYQKALKDFAAEFQKTTGASVDFDFQPWEQLMPKVQADLASGTPQYDMFCDDIEFQYTIYPNLLPLNDLIKKYNYDMTGFFDPVYKYGEGVAGGLKGTRFGLPIRVGASWVFYRKDLIDKFPTTWAEYEKVLAANTGKGKYGVAFAGVAAQLVKLFLARYWSTGSKLMTKDWKPLINSDAGAKALQQLMDHASKYAAPGVLGWDNPDAAAAFLNGDAAVMEGWASFILPSLQDPTKSKVVDKWAVAPYPEGGSGNFTQHNLTILKTTKNADAAFEFIAYATGMQNAKRVLVDYNEESPRMPVWTDAAIVKDHPYLPDVAKSYQNGKPFTPGLPQWLEMFIGLAEGLSAALSKQATAKDALDGIAKKWTDLIQQAPPTFDYPE